MNKTVFSDTAEYQASLKKAGVQTCLGAGKYPMPDLFVRNIASNIVIMNQK